MTHNYTVFGFRVTSDFRLPELIDSKVIGDHPAISIEKGIAPTVIKDEVVGNWLMKISQNQCLYDIPTVGRFFIDRGDRIIVEPIEKVTSQNIRAFLFGPAIGTLLHQRGVFPLHMSAVSYGNSSIGFTGVSGAGKSTMALAIYRTLGLKILCDDLGIVDLNPEGALLYSGLGRLKVRADSLNALKGGIAVCPSVNEFETKYHLHQKELFTTDGTSINTLIELVQSDQELVREINGFEKYSSLIKAIYKPYMARIMGREQQLSDYISTLASHLRFIQVSRKNNVDRTFEVPDYVSDLLRK